MAEQKNHSIRMSPDTAKELKVQAAQSGVTQGELIAALLALAERGELTDAQICAALNEHHARGGRR